MERTNPWWKGESDPAYEQWSKLQLRWVPKEISKLSLKPFSLNFLYGPRQVGKTTSLKILANQLLQNDVMGRDVFYLSCDEISDYKELGELLDSYLATKRDLSRSRRRSTSYILLDEITFVDEWWRAVKARIDDHSFSNHVLTITGSASLDILRQREHFPGRRGNGTDVIMRPLGFRSYVEALGKLELSRIENLARDFDTVIKANMIYSDSLSQLFSNYLETGGFPLPIKDKVESGRISEAARKSMIDGLRGDWLRVGRSDKFMKEVISYIISARGTPVSWLSISKATSIGSSHTSQAYVETLAGLLLVCELDLIQPDGIVAIRKNKKIHFNDPFSYSTLAEYAGADIDEAACVEGVAASHLSRMYNTYYWRNGTEVDIVANLRVKNSANKQLGFEVKWNFKKGTKPRHIKQYFTLNKKTLPVFLASLPFT